ncbi:transposable element Tc1 transposase [Trichonephila clavipes]|nr:transposable element Tc1 transposase [Trichonephila clavipes]
MVDNSRPHRTLAVEELLESGDITRMDWPAYYPDLNRIEHVWDALRRRIAARLHHLENTEQLKQMLIVEWALLPQEMLHQLVLSATETSGNITSRVIERDASEEDLLLSRRFQRVPNSPTWSPMTPKYSPKSPT